LSRTDGSLNKAALTASFKARLKGIEGDCETLSYPDGIKSALAGSFAVPMELMVKKHPEDSTQNRRNDSDEAITNW
jgi:hypothetical protein